MFCNNCGQPVEEEKAFCKVCGALVGTTMTSGAPQVYGSPARPRFEARQTGGRGPLIAGIVVAVIVILAGAGVGVYFGFIRDGATTDDHVAVTTASTAAGQSTSTSVGTSSTAGPTTTTLAGGATGTTIPSSGSTVQTVPSLNTTTSKATTTTTRIPLDAYLTVTDELIADLEADDARIPELATEINSTAPKVPKSVHAELRAMADMLDARVAKLYAFDVPSGFEESFRWLDEATTYMVARINATIAGIEAMWNTGKVSSANSYFNEGRVDRDAYRKAMAQYHELLPID